MNAREAIAEAIRYGGRATAINKALFVIEGLRARGFVILPRSEVEAIREALEPFANRAFQFDGADDDWFCNPSLQVKHLRAANDAIRKLKSGGE